MIEEFRKATRFRVGGACFCDSVLVQKPNQLLSSTLRHRSWRLRRLHSRPSEFHQQNHHVCSLRPKLWYRVPTKMHNTLEIQGGVRREAKIPTFPSLVSRPLCLSTEFSSPYVPTSVSPILPYLDTEAITMHRNQQMVVESIESRRHRESP
jgi:hypothetical protein